MKIKNFIEYSKKFNHTLKLLVNNNNKILIMIFKISYQK